ncbi:MAG: tetratricopeptide repeat protein [Syntrophomonadaceae bacterium]
MDTKKIGIIALLTMVFVVGIGLGLWSRGSADRAQEKLDLAVKYISENDFENAILAYNDAIAIDSKQVKAYQGLARVYTLQGKYENAKAAYDKGVAGVYAKDQIILRLALAGMYIDKGQLPDAEKSYQEIINSQQNCLEAYWGLAMVYQKQGDNIKAEAALKQAVAKYPNDYRGYNTLALFLKQNNKADDAFNNLVKSLGIEINQQEAYLVLGDLYKGRWNELPRKLPTVSNPQVSATLELYMYYASDDYTKAVNIYKTKLSGQADNHKALILAAIAMVKINDKTGADNLIGQLLNKKFSDWLLSDLALYYHQLGDTEKVRLCAIKAVQANGGNLDAISLLLKINSGDEKIYSALFLLYNWRPLGPAKDALQERNLTIPGDAKNGGPGGGKIVQLSVEEKTNWNKYFSAFTNARVAPFKEGEIGNKELISFGFFHNYLKAQPQDGKLVLAAQKVEDSVREYFGKDVQHQSVDGNLTYSQGFYYFPAAYGEGAPFSQITKLVDLGNDYYLADVNVYTEKGFDGIFNKTGDPNYIYKPIEGWSKTYVDEVEVTRQMQAKVKKVTEGGQSRYILIQYLNASGQSTNQGGSASNSGNENRNTASQNNDNGDKFIGKWQKVGSSSIMLISKSGDIYISREYDGDHQAVYENGRLKIKYREGYFYATINANGNLVMEGIEEYRRVN